MASALSGCAGRQRSSCCRTRPTRIPFNPGACRPPFLRSAHRSWRRLALPRRLDVDQVVKRPRASPELERNGQWVDVHPDPPGGLVAIAVQFAVVQATDWNRVLVADLAAES